MPASMSPDGTGPDQPFISHLVELRHRLIRMLVAVGLFALLLFPFANQLYTFVAQPLLAHLSGHGTMIATQVAAPFLTPFKLALVAAVFLAMPYLLYQVWAFVAPGLYRHEQRLALPLLVSSVLLFYVGVAFAYLVVFPLVFAFLSGTTPTGVEMMTDISAYLDFVLTLFFAFGLAFEIPVATILLVAIGVITPQDLASKRPYVIVGAFVIGMFLTPPDVISQTLLAVPMWVLFELGLLFSRILLNREVAQNDDRAEDEAHGEDELDGSTGGFDPMSMSSCSAPAAAAAVGGLDSDEEGDDIEDKIRLANRLRELEDEAAARRLLYEVLEEGNADQRRVARDILAQIDQ